MAVILSINSATVQFLFAILLDIIWSKVCQIIPPVNRRLTDVFTPWAQYWRTTETVSLAIIYSHFYLTSFWLSVIWRQINYPVIWNKVIFLLLKFPLHPLFWLLAFILCFFYSQWISQIVINISFCGKMS